MYFITFLSESGAVIFAAERGVACSFWKAALLFLNYDRMTEKSSGAFVPVECLE